MAITALNSAATGLRALSTRIDVIANNLANAETTGFKRQRVNFEDLFYLNKRNPGTVNGLGETSPAGIQVGLGVKISNTQIDLEQGTLDPTGGKLDVAIEGQGFFKVKVADGIGDGYAYTRNGDFFVNKDGELVLGLGDGYKLDPPITLPTDIDPNSLSISEDGTLSAVPAGDVQAQVLGRFGLTRFVNPQGLAPHRRQPLHPNARQRPAPRKRAGRRRHRPRATGLPRRLQRRPRQGARQPDQNAAQLRAQQPVDPDRRPGVANHRESATLLSGKREVRSEE